MKQCINCIQVDKCFKYDTIDTQYRQFCIDHDMCSFEQNPKRPLYNMEVAKQLIFACAAELCHGTEGLSNEEIGDKLFAILDEMDKMQEE